MTTNVHLEDTTAEETTNILPECVLVPPNTYVYIYIYIHETTYD